MNISLQFEVSNITALSGEINRNKTLALVNDNKTCIEIANFTATKEHSNALLGSGPDFWNVMHGKNFLKRVSAPEGEDGIQEIITSLAEHSTIERLGSEVIYNAIKDQKLAPENIEVQP